MNTVTVVKVGKDGKTQCRTYKGGSTQYKNVIQGTKKTTKAKKAPAKKAPAKKAPAKKAPKEKKKSLSSIMAEVKKDAKYKKLTAKVNKLKQEAREAKESGASKGRGSEYDRLRDRIDTLIEKQSDIQHKYLQKYGRI